MRPAAPILLFGDPCLRRACRPAQPGTPETARLLDRLWDSLLAGDGVGLAAPQIGEDLTVLVARDPRRAGAERRLELVNPVVQESCGPLRVFEEGCLSFPGLFLKISRPAGVTVAYRDREGQQQRLRTKGLIARVVQHEIDHLEGRLFIDHLQPLRRWSIAPRLWWIRLAGSWTKGRDRA